MPSPYRAVNTPRLGYNKDCTLYWQYSVQQAHTDVTTGVPREGLWGCSNPPEIPKISVESSIA